MRVKFNFNLSTWMRNVEVEAKSYDEALEELYKMSLADLLEAGYDDETSISDIDGEIVEKTMKVTAYDIDYIIEEDDFESTEEYIEALNSLPTELTFEITVEPTDDIETLIADEITYQTDWMADHFSYVIVDEK